MRVQQLHFLCLSLCRGTWDPLVPCPFYHNLPRLSPQNLYRILRNFEGETLAVFESLRFHTADCLFPLAITLYSNVFHRLSPRCCAITGTTGARCRWWSGRPRTADNGC